MNRVGAHHLPPNAMRAFNSKRIKEKMKCMASPSNFILFARGNSEKLCEEMFVQPLNLTQNASKFVNLIFE